VHGNEIDSFFCMPGDGFKQFVRAKQSRVTFFLVGAKRRVINRHCAHWNGGPFDNLLPQVPRSLSGGKIHHGIRPGIYGGFELGKFLLGIVAGETGADIGVDLYGKGLAYALGL
jgi:hypothetical protein